MNIIQEALKLISSPEFAAAIKDALKKQEEKETDSEKQNESATTGGSTNQTSQSEEVSSTVTENFRLPSVKSDAPKSLKIMTWLIWAATGIGTAVVQVLQALGILTV